MRFIFISALLLAVVTATLQVQNAFIKEAAPNIENHVDSENVNKIMMIIEERSVKDLWNSIMNSGKNIWESVKNLANISKEKIKNWISNVKNRVNEIKIEFEAHLKVFQEIIRKSIEELIKTSHVLKTCVKDYEKSIDETVKHIINHVTSCISGNVTKLSQIEMIKFEGSQFNEDLLLEAIEKKLAVCLKAQDVEACAYDAKMAIMDEANNKEREILINHEYMRLMLDDILDDIITCSVDGLIHASANITNEAVKIIKCVLN